MMLVPGGSMTGKVLFKGAHCLSDIAIWPFHVLLFRRDSFDITKIISGVNRAAIEMC